MLCLLKAEWSVEAGNAVIRNGKMAKMLEMIMEDLKPESVYFLAQNGKRTGFFFVDLKDASQIPAVAEPFFHAFHANLEIIPVMKPEDLQKAAPSMEKAVKRYC